AAVPADHDDDDGGAAGGAAAGAGDGGGVGAAAAARHHDRGRSDREPDADALYDAGRLPLSRPHAALVPAAEARRQTAGRVRRGAGRRETVMGRAGRGLAVCRVALVTATVALVTGCVVGPDYTGPTVITPDAYKEVEGWTVARPQDEARRGAWWEIFADPQLDALAAQVSVSNQTLAVAEAQFRQARALVREARAAYFPTVTLGIGYTRSRQSATLGGVKTATTGPVSTFTAPLDVSWELDLWGRVRRAVESNAARP